MVMSRLTQYLANIMIQWPGPETPAYFDEHLPAADLEL